MQDEDGTCHRNYFLQSSINVVINEGCDGKHLGWGDDISTARAQVRAVRPNYSVSILPFIATYIQGYWTL